jgi:hypothetical protein
MSLNNNLNVPPHILDAANLITKWAAENNHKEFVIGSICSTSCLDTSHSLVKLYKHYLRTQVDPALTADPPKRDIVYELPSVEKPTHSNTPAENFDLMFRGVRENNSPAQES